MNSSASATTTVNYKAPVQDIRFQLEAFKYEDVAALEAFEDYDLEMAMGILEEASELLIETWLPTNQIGDIEGVHFANSVIATANTEKRHDRVKMMVRIIA